MNQMNLKQTARTLFDAGVRAVAPDVCVIKHLLISGNWLCAGDIDLDLDRIRFSQKSPTMWWAACPMP